MKIPKTVALPMGSGRWPSMHSANAHANFQTALALVTLAMHHQHDYTRVDVSKYLRDHRLDSCPVVQRHRGRVDVQFVEKVTQNVMYPILPFPRFLTNRIFRILLVLAFGAQNITKVLHCNHYSPNLRRV